MGQPAYAPAYAPALALVPPPPEARPVDPLRVACFGIVSEPDPGALPRLLEPFAKRGLVPLSIAVRHLEAEEQLVTDIQVRGLPRDESDYVARALRTIPVVRQVVTTERYPAERARRED